MAISTIFLELFGSFVKQYEKGNDGYLTRSPEDRSNFIDKFTTYLSVLKEPENCFNDLTIIEVLSLPISAAANTHPFLAQCWAEFLDKYAKEKKTSFSIDSTVIPAGPETRKGERLEAELHATIVKMRQLHEDKEKFLRAELERVTLQAADLSLQLHTANNTNYALQMQTQLQLRDLQVLESLRPQLVDTAKQLAAAAKLIQDVTSQLHPTAPGLEMPSAPVEQIITKVEPSVATLTPPTIIDDRSKSHTPKPPTQKPLLTTHSSRNIFSDPAFLKTLNDKMGNLRPVPKDEKKSKPR